MYSSMNMQNFKISKDKKGGWNSTFFFIVRICVGGDILTSLREKMNRER